MLGLDGDVNCQLRTRLNLYLTWEDNRSSKKIYGTRLTNLELEDDNGSS